MLKQVADKVWVKTKAMAAELGCHPSTLLNLKKSGYLREGQHWRKIDPTAPRGNFVWHHTRTLIKMGAV